MSKAYGLSIALDAVSLGVACGSFTAVVGRKGSGKSTLVRCASGRSEPTSGTVWRSGALSEPATPAMPGPASCGWHDEVVAGLRLDDSVEIRAGDYAERAIIGRSLLCRPNLLLADEPTRGLDAGYREPVVRRLRRLVDQHEWTVLVTTADPAVAVAADVAMFLENGRFVDAVSEPTATTVARQLADRR